MKPLNIQQKLKPQWVALAILAASAACVCAQSSDAIIDKLVDKGILTVKEANELREESDKNFGQAYSVKSGMPDWVTSLKFSGDVRARYDGVNFNNSHFLDNTGATNSMADRSRYRFRIRFGATVTMFDNLEAGFKLTSGDSVGGFSTGNPLSGNSTMQDNGSKKMIYVDQAYGRWYALNEKDWNSVITIGKMENPFTLDELVFDPDYTPEGASAVLGYRFNDHHALKLIGGGFVVDEFALSSSDPYLLGAQMRWDANWNSKVSSSVGIAGLMLGNATLLTNALVPNVNRGNTRTITGAPAYNFNPIVVDGALTYTATSFPFYSGAFPIRLFGEYMVNPAAPDSVTTSGYTAENYGWNAGITLGKSGKRGTWELSYFYRWLGGNAWYEELVDDDFGAFYGGVVGSDSPPSAAGGAGYASGTNVKGHILRFAYSPTDSVTLAAKCFFTELINPFPATGTGSDSKTMRMQLDAMWKF